MIKLSEEGFDFEGEELNFEDDDDAPVEDYAVSCPYCGGEAMPLGLLGNRMHHRCRQCGMNVSREEAR